MKYIKSYILFAFMTLAFTGCKTDDLKDDLNDLKDRVALLEQQVKIVNDNAQAIAYILDPQNVAISGVEYNDDEKTQFTITLTNGDELTLTVGKPGEINETPSINVTEDGYWEINGVKSQYKAVGEDGANGDGVPQFKVEDGTWKVSFDGQGWTPVEGGNIDGVTGNLGDQFFKSAQLIEDGKYFEITTLEGEVYKLPVTSLTCEIKVDDSTTQPIPFAAGDIKDFDVKISGGEPLAPIYPAGWRAELVKKSQADSEGYNYTLTVYALAASRAVADNKSDISVRVTDGTSWAVDKITVTLAATPAP